LDPITTSHHFTPSYRPGGRHCLYSGRDLFQGIKSARPRCDDEIDGLPRPAFPEVPQDAEADIIVTATASI